MEDERRGTWSRMVFTPLAEGETFDDLRAEQEAEQAARMSPVPDWLRPAADAVVADFEGDDPLGVKLAYRLDDEPEAFDLLLISVDGWSYGVPVSEGESRTATMIRIAEALEYLSESPAAWAQPRPVCPGHGHPAEPVLEGGTAYWICPAERQRLAPVGALH